MRFFFFFIPPQIIHAPQNTILSFWLCFAPRVSNLSPASHTNTQNTEGRDHLLRWSFRNRIQGRSNIHKIGTLTPCHRIIHNFIFQTRHSECSSPMCVCVQFLSSFQTVLASCSRSPPAVTSLRWIYASEHNKIVFHIRLQRKDLKKCCSNIKG